MPEILTKHPDVLLTILKDANIACGHGAQQRILTHCPAKQFCALPTGELCIYGTKDVSQMKQLNPFDVMFTSQAIIALVSFTLMVLLLGIWLGSRFKNL